MHLTLVSIFNLSTNYTEKYHSNYDMEKLLSLDIFKTPGKMLCTISISYFVKDNFFPHFYFTKYFLFFSTKSFIK